MQVGFQWHGDWCYTAALWSCHHLPSILHMLPKSVSKRTAVVMSFPSPKPPCLTQVWWLQAVSGIHGALPPVPDGPRFSHTVGAQVKESARCSTNVTGPSPELRFPSHCSLLGMLSSTFPQAFPTSIPTLCKSRLIKNATWFTMTSWSLIASSPKLSRRFTWKPLSYIIFSPTVWLVLDIDLSLLKEPSPDG